ncbi:hypothetical protein AgCh_029784 [Apium graveolens]
MTTLCTQDSYWHRKANAIGLLGLLPQQKMTTALQMLVYGAAADQCAEICRMGESITLECMKKLCQQMEGLFGEEYIRAPTHADLRRFLTRGIQRGFSGMIGSIDCMYREWKNCTSGWGGAYSGRKGQPTIILEVIASYNTWMWHAFFGVPGAQNDINILGQSPLFDKVIAGNSPTVVFHVNGKRYNNVYYLAEGIYPRYSTFVKTISNPTTQSQKLFARKQEAYRKDVERYFGILQSRWAILRHGAQMHRRSIIRGIMMTCIILHNIIVEDKFVEDEFVELVEEDLMNSVASQKKNFGGMSGVFSDSQYEVMKGQASEFELEAMYERMIQKTLKLDCDRALAMVDRKLGSSQNKQYLWELKARILWYKKIYDKGVFDALGNIFSSAGAFRFPMTYLVYGTSLHVKEGSDDQLNLYKLGLQEAENKNDQNMINEFRTRIQLREEIEIVVVWMNFWLIYGLRSELRL